MAKTITLTIEKKQYNLEYSRATVAMIEGQGFSLEKISEKPITMMMMLFYGAFAKNHSSVKRAKLDDIYDRLTHRGDLTKQLLEMYTEAFESLANEEDDDAEGNANWVMSEN